MKPKMKSHPSLPIEGEQGGGLLNLTLPTGWNQCTPEQLEQIIIAQQVAQGNNTAWKLECFLRLTGLTMLEPPDTSLPLEEQTITVSVERKEKKGWWSRLSWRPIVNFQLSTFNFQLSIWQIHYWIKEHLAWLDTPPTIIRFPYPVWTWKGEEFHGPKTYCADWSWGQYRIAQDYLEYYFKVIGRPDLKDLKDPKALKDFKEAAAKAAALFLATIYNPRITYTDPDTHQPRTDWRYTPEQTTANADAFTNFSDIQFQVILLWWSSVMARLHRIYPKCFKTSDDNKKKKKRHRTQDPMEQYAKLTATLQQLTNFDSQRLDHEPHEVILQRLTQMITENEEMERIRNRKH